MEEGKITLRIYRGNGDVDLIQELESPSSDLRVSTAVVSRAAKDYFERDDHFFNRRNVGVAADEDYQFLSRSIPVTSEYGNEKMTINLTDPSLRKWIKQATDIIKEKTGITPGAQNLTAAQRIQIYRVFHNDIVPLVESPRRSQEYTYFHDLILRYHSHNRLNLEENNTRNRFQLLGHILDNKSAICGELSAFGAVLFSEYGLHTRYMQTVSKND